MTQIEWALYEEPVFPSCTALCSQQCSWGPCSALPHSDQLSQNCPQRCVRVLMDFYLMRDDISYGFHNSQAMWPKDHHAWQHLLLHSLTKLGVHWVCVDCKTCNVQCRFRTHWVKCISLERQKHQEKLWEKKFKNTHSNFSLQKPAHSFSLLIQGFFFALVFFYFILWTTEFPWRHEANQTVLGELFPTNTGSGGNKSTLGPCSICGPLQCASQPSKL